MKIDLTCSECQSKKPPKLLELDTDYALLKCPNPKCGHIGRIVFVQVIEKLKEVCENGTHCDRY